MPQPSPGSGRGPWVARCNDVGPYVKERFTAGHRRQLVALACTRPRGHDGPHLHATLERGVEYEWTRDGRPIRPLPIKREV